MRQTFAIGIGGAAGQGVATPGDIFAKIFSRRGLHLNAYNAYQSIIRGGHTFLTIRTGSEKVTIEPHGCRHTSHLKGNGGNLFNGHICLQYRAMCRSHGSAVQSYP